MFSMGLCSFLQSTWSHHPESIQISLVYISDMQYNIMIVYYVI